MEEWRELTPEVRQEFFDWVKNTTVTRHHAGAREHGDVFHGDPIDNAIEEALDLLFYLWMAKRQRLHIITKDW